MADLAIVVPVHNESACIRPLLEEIHAVLEGRLDFEIVTVDDGSTDDTPAVLRSQAARFPRLRIVTHPARSGQSAALHTGVVAAGAPWVATIDGDGQNDPAGILRLWNEKLATPDADRTFFIGHRQGRKGAIRRLSSRIANGVRSRLLRDDTPDVGCGLKLFRRDSYLSLPFFDHMHRFLPALFQARGVRVVSIPVIDRPRIGGRSHYGINNRLWVGLVDVAGLLWLTRRMRAADPAAPGARRTAPVPGRDGGTAGPGSDEERTAPPGRRGNAIRLAGAWAILTAMGLAVRPLLPVDETRYLSVAWEMWNRHDWLVPHLNGLPYSDKPPLLFWLILSGWKLFGVHVLWGRLVGPLFGLLSLYLVARIARSLWPAERDAGASAAWIALGCTLWVAYGTLVMFDTLLTFFVLLGVLGLVRAARQGGFTGWVLFALGTGGGLLTKGPVALLHLLPPALLAPWWAPAFLPGRRAWYSRLGMALLGGIAIVLLWAVPAAFQGGPGYSRSIFLSQTSGRVVSAFAHRRPDWWYLPILPLALIPWVLLPGFWRGLRSLRRILDPGTRLCLAWFVPGFVTFSLISGKQIHYLLPLVPPMALLVMRVLRAETPGGAATSAPVASAGAPLSAGLSRIATAAVFTAVLAQAVAFPWIRAHYDLQPVAGYLQSLERQGRPIAHVGKYSGQYHFLGRLQRPFEVIDTSQVAGWLRNHPNGAVVSYTHSARADAPLGAFIHQYEDAFVVVRLPGPTHAL